MAGNVPPHPKSSKFDKPLYVSWPQRGVAKPLCHIARGQHETLCGRKVGSAVNFDPQKPEHFFLCEHCRRKQERRTAQIAESAAAERTARLTFEASFVLPSGVVTPDVGEIDDVLGEAFIQFLKGLYGDTVVADTKSKLATKRAA